ncbi:MAG TPA: hypothetical protein PJ986_04065 [Gammaproteobacteria bacterium]|nr:hypothetical protein [Gammaproteobacteria bacterium]
MGFTVFDVVSGEINVGDFVSGPLNDHGDAVLKNLTTGERIEVYVEAIQATQSAARDLLS